MEGLPQEAASSPHDLASAVDSACAFFGALFVESDTILVRPIETWVENGKKRSRVDYRNTIYVRATPESVRARVRRLLAIADQERVNLFFGVCPRLGDQGRFDLAWQIRTVRTLWTDIDHISVEEARQRVAEANLPLLYSDNYFSGLTTIRIPG